MGSASSYIDIPENIKQANLPFALKPGKDINTVIGSSKDAAKKKPQIFSFRRSSLLSGKKGLLGICPASFDKFVKNDLSYKLLFNRNKDSYKIEKKEIDSDTLFNSIPAIQIREFQPESAINYLCSFIAVLADKLKSVSSKVTSSADQNDSTATLNAVKHELQTSLHNIANNETGIQAFGKAMWNTITWFVKYVAGVNPDDSLMTDVSAFFAKCGASDVANGVSDNVKTSLMNFPFSMYYRFMTTTTTNIYELPYISTGNQMDSSNGASGWGAGKADIPLGGEGLFGSIAKTLFGNIRVNYISPWDAIEGHVTMGDKISVEVDLFNDDIEKALANFIFVNTIIPNNRWFQYSFFQNPSSLYDIKIEGCNRLFACTGQFSVSYKGILRDPSLYFIQQLYGLHKNPNYNFSDKDLLKNKIIKVPDIYHVKMDFQSCIPQNFNTWLFQYSSKNSNHIDSKYANDSYESNIITDAISAIVQRFTDKVSKQYNSAEASSEPAASNTPDDYKAGGQ